MSMFDTIVVKQKLIDPLLENEKEIKDALKEAIEDDYYYFQTKDLLNFLHYYFIDEDQKLHVERSTIDADEDSKFGIKETVKPKEFCSNVTQYIEFYDHLGNVGEYSVFITFKAHVVNGEVKSIVLHDLEKISIAEQRKEYEEHQKFREKLEATWEVKLYRRLTNIQHSSIIRFVSNKYYKFKDYLWKRAEERIHRETEN
jgi:hypothetical protein